MKTLIIATIAAQETKELCEMLITFACLYCAGLAFIYWIWTPPEDRRK